ncbi:unnamed protein product [Rotaria socialis]|nr:unnamed protein product [Rotaria socialis]CAF3442678.1 unnamed protein product [Rotaria socialis]CAF3515525.1 unnamed protein product [Rotaria socialis]CAF3590936.1 unnamed protein product [Rotaria socialis]CAF3660337.1 unnamed protein product [Rotaria socialis]
MADILSLEQLVHLSLGDPEAGAVNFNVLKTLLLQMLKAMNLYNYKPTMSDDDQRTLKEALSTTIATSSSSPPLKQHVSFDKQEIATSDNENETNKKAQRRIRDRSSDRLNALEEKIFRFESQLDAFNQIPSNAEVIDRTKQMQRKTSDHDDQTRPTNRHGPILEIWQYTQMEKRIESAENGITRLASLLQDLFSEMDDLKESNESMKKTTDDLKKQHDELQRIVDMLNNEKNDWAKKSDVENLEEKIRNLQNLLASLRDRLNEIPRENSDGVVMPDLSGYVTWDRLEDALKGIRESIEKSSHDAAAALASAKDTRPPVQVIERQSQTSAKRKDSPVVTNTVPSDRLAEILETLGTLNHRHEQLRALVEALELNKLDRDEFEAFKNQYYDLLDRLASLERTVDHLQSQGINDNSAPSPVREIIREVPSQSRTDYSGEMADFRTALQRLREELDRIRKLIQDLTNKGNLSAQDIETLKKLVQQLDQTKADKAYVNNELDKKADKRDIENRVLKKDFNSACGELSQNINDCLQRFCVHDDTQKQDLDKMNHEIDSKLDRLELDALRDYMEKQMKKLKRLAKEQQQTQQQHVHVMSEDEAAGLRKQLIRFHCISCDRPIDVQPHPQQPSLPINQAMRPIQSPRPYTTYELDQIRQFQKSQQLTHELSGGAADVYATVRQCGGSHTMTLPFKRQTKGQLGVPEEPVLTRNEVDIKGHDGVIYKGRIDADKLPSVDLHKKHSVVLRASFPQPKSRTESHQIPIHYHHQHESPNNDLDRNDESPLIPNLEPSLPREESYT